MKVKHIQHLYWRAGFGINPYGLSLLANKSKIEIVEEIFNASSSFSPLTITTPEIDAAINAMKKPSKSKLKELIKKSNQKSLEYNI